MNEIEKILETMKIKVIIKKPGQISYVLEIENNLKEYQKIVGGYIETLKSDDIIMIINEEGKINNLPINFFITRDFICGTAIFAGLNNEGEFTDVPVKYQRNFNLLFTKY